MDEHMTFQQFRDAMWYDADVEYSVRQMMLDYDPEVHGRRVAAEKECREQIIADLWQERNRATK